MEQREIKMSDSIKSARSQKVLSVIDSVPDRIELPGISGWLEKNKYNPPGSTPEYGMHKASTAPHMVEIVECLHPYNPVNWVSIMKSVQSTGTYHVLCAVAYYIKHQICSIGFYTASQELARENSSSLIDPLIDNCGLAGLVKPISKRNVRKRADSVYYKEFSGGIKMIINSYGSISGMKSNTLGLIVLDEVDEAAADLNSQGHPVRIIYGRTKALRNYKIIELSTPTSAETSRISEGFNAGDQRRYYVPCPLCGESQELFFKMKEHYGLTYDFDTVGRKRVMIPESVRYICKFCRGEWRESAKKKVLDAGKWVPHSRPINPFHRSYHVSGLIAPESFLSWTRICADHAETNAGEDILKLKDFYINDLGLPWLKVHTRSSWQKLKEKAEDYACGETPPGALMLFGGVDCQADRIELVIIGLGREMNSWLIEYEVFHGDLTKGVVWSALREYVNGYNHVKMGQIIMTAVDTGYDPSRVGGVQPVRTGGVMAEIARSGGKFIPVRGASSEKGEFLTRKRVFGIPGLSAQYYINTGAIKSALYESLENPDTDYFKPHFPKKIRGNAGEKIPAPDHLYRSFCSERYQQIRKTGKDGWKKIYERNEVLDCYVYAIAAAIYSGMHNKDSAEFWDSYEKSLDMSAGV